MLISLLASSLLIRVMTVLHNVLHFNDKSGANRKGTPAMSSLPLTNDKKVVSIEDKIILLLTFPNRIFGSPNEAKDKHRKMIKDILYDIIDICKYLEEICKKQTLKNFEDPLSLFEDSKLIKEFLSVKEYHMFLVFSAKAIINMIDFPVDFLKIKFSCLDKKDLELVSKVDDIIYTTSLNYCFENSSVVFTAYIGKLFAADKRWVTWKNGNSNNSILDQDFGVTSKSKNSKEGNSDLIKLSTETLNEVINPAVVRKGFISRLNWKQDVIDFSFLNECSLSEEVISNKATSSDMKIYINNMISDFLSNSTDMLLNLSDIELTDLERFLFLKEIYSIDRSVFDLIHYDNSDMSSTNVLKTLLKIRYPDQYKAAIKEMKESSNESINDDNVNSDSLEENLINIGDFDDSNNVDELEEGECFEHNTVEEKSEIQATQETGEKSINVENENKTKDKETTSKEKSKVEKETSHVSSIVKSNELTSSTKKTVPSDNFHARDEKRPKLSQFAESNRSHRRDHQDSSRKHEEYNNENPSRRPERKYDSQNSYSQRKPGVKPESNNNRGSDNKASANTNNDKDKGRYANTKQEYQREERRNWTSNKNDREGSYSNNKTQNRRSRSPRK